MPDIEVLMEAWPPEVEEILGNVNLLTPELDIPLEDYARMVSEPDHVNLTVFIFPCWWWRTKRCIVWQYRTGQNNGRGLIKLSKTLSL